MQKSKIQKRIIEYQLILIFIVMLGIFGLAQNSKAAELLWSDNFESGIGAWSNPFGSNSQSSEQAHTGNFSKKSDSAIGTPSCTRDITGDSNDMPATNKLYVSFWVYLPNGSDFNGKFCRLYNSPSIYEAQIEFWGSVGNVGEAGFVGNIFYTGNYYSRVNGSSCIAAASDIGSVGSSGLVEGQWNHVEFFVELNDIGSANGRIRTWLNRSADNFDTPTADGTGLTLRAEECPTTYATLHLPTGYSSSMPVIYMDDVEAWDGLPNETSDTTPPNAPSGLSIS